ncbi:MAG: hypothetical protein J3R72DRAFT_432988 [Linnemannia gamsii]|nr:MAG: hypothetical protein J3R72DRAFT_432988 [Linnemannia gamsii]
MVLLVLWGLIVLDLRDKDCGATELLLLLLRAVLGFDDVVESLCSATSSSSSTVVNICGKISCLAFKKDARKKIQLVNDNACGST